MKLLTKNIRAKLPELYTQEDKGRHGHCSRQIL